VKSNILKVVWQWEFWFGSISYVESSILDLAVTMGPIYKEFFDQLTRNLEETGDNGRGIVRQYDTKIANKNNLSDET